MTKTAKSPRIINGRLQPKRSTWTIEEAKLIATLYKSRGELFHKNKTLYHAAYTKGWLNTICAHMKPSRKKNKYTYGILNPNKVLALALKSKNHRDFCINHRGAYDAMNRFGIDTLELFDNLDSAEYIKNLIITLSEDSIDRFTENLC